MVLDIALGIILAVFILMISSFVLILIYEYWIEAIAGIISLAIGILLLSLISTNIESLKIIFGRFITPLIFLIWIGMTWSSIKDKKYFWALISLLCSALTLTGLYYSWQ